MATKQDIINLIDSNLKSGGNASGPAINALLKSMLDFTENKGVGFFSFENEQQDYKKMVFLSYSFRGIAYETVNFTFALQANNFGDIKDLKKFKFIFNIEPMLYNTLKSIYKKDGPIYFTVPMQLLGNDMFVNNIIAIALDDNGQNKQLVIEIQNPRNIKSAFTIFTSIHFHSPDFNKI